MVTEPERQSIVDEEHLKLLSIGYWVWGGIMGAYALFMAAYFLFIGFFFASIPDGGDAPPAVLRWIFVAVAVVVLCVAGTIAGVQIANGFWIRRRTHRVLSMVIAGFTCASVPVGTMLGVFSFMVLARPSVRAMYGEPTPAPQLVSPPPVDYSADVPPDGPPLT